MKPAFIITIADLAFILFLNATSQDAALPAGMRVDHAASRQGALEPVRIERAYVRFVATTSEAFRSELSFAGQVVQLGPEPTTPTLPGAARALAHVKDALTSVGAPPKTPVVLQLVLPEDTPLGDVARIHAKAREIGLDCEVVSSPGESN